ncbi:restriction endonuclease subunit S [Vibrio fluvialis]|nr:restriction endonuclease subunit S [Vibrio fluvialis]
MSELPKGWTSKLLGELASTITKGTTPTTVGYSFETEGVPFVKVENIESNRIQHTTIYQYINEDAHASLSRSAFQAGDVLFSIAGTIGKTALVTDNDLPCNTNQAIAIIRGTQEVLLPLYLKHNLSYRAKEIFIANARGGAMNNVSLGDLKKTFVVIPPLPEQKRIVEKLDEVLAQVDTIKARLDGIPDLLKRFRQSVLASAVSGKLTEEWREQNDNLTSMTAYLEALSVEREAEYHCSCEEAKAVGARKPRKPSCIDPNVFASPEWVEKFVPKLPDKWAVSCIGNIGQNNADSIVDGPFGASINVKTDYIESGVPVIRINNINPFKFDNENLKFISEEKFADLKRHNVKGGDLLLGKVGTIGNACIYPLGSEEAMLSTTGSTRIRVDTRVCVLKFAELYLNSQKAAFNNIASAAVQPFLNMKTIKSFPFIAPPISEQKEIVRLVDQYFAFADTIEAQVKKAQARVDNLTQSILAKAFRGELVPQNDDDEPAEVLLERIAKARKEAEALAKVAKKAGKKKA